jgi:GWxTD domain-containing protein
MLAGTDRSDLNVKTVVYDAVGKEIISREKPRKRVSESNVLVDNIVVGKLRTGTYSVILAVLDTSGKVLTSTGKKFYVYNSTLGIDSTLVASKAALLANEYATMSEEDIDKEFEWARYAAMDEEKDQYKELKGVDAKRKFLSDWWRRRPLGFKEEYLQRVGYANTALRVMGREGYKTDRGRVYIVYGPPDDYDRHPSDPDSRPYEVWSYNSIQGGVIFAFVLRQSGGDYELVHSTHRNELHDENWMRFAVTR